VYVPVAGVLLGLDILTQKSLLSDCGSSSSQLFPFTVNLSDKLLKSSGLENVKEYVVYEDVRLPLQVFLTLTPSYTLTTNDAVHKSLLVA
jgi:hypothetical protein